MVLDLSFSCFIVIKFRSPSSLCTADSGDLVGRLVAQEKCLVAMYDNQTVVT